VENLNPNLKPEDFWALLEQSPLVPNFWMTEEYVQRKGLQWVEEDGEWGWQELEEGGWIFPPIHNTGPNLFGFDLKAPCWAGFLVKAMDVSWDQAMNMLDQQFIYDPKQFMDLTGSRWKVFRKNVRKYPDRFPGFLEYKSIQPGEYDLELTEMLLNWAGAKEVQDNEVMVDYLFNGNQRWGLFRDGKLEGVNVADENHKHLIFRYCLDCGIPFLNEYLRWKFYTDPYVQSSGKLVNDGGSLGSQGLFTFKMKLNPVEVYHVVTTLKKGV